MSSNIGMTNNQQGEVLISGDKTVDSIGKVNVGYLGGITEITRDHIYVCTSW